jgi:hypothetical protein
MEFMIPMQTPEACDTTVEYLSVPGAAAQWDATVVEGWCPWALDVVELKCPGHPAVVSPTAINYVALDMNDSVVNSYCEP